MTVKNFAPLRETVLSGALELLGALWSVWPDRDLRPSFRHWNGTTGALG